MLLLFSSDAAAKPQKKKWQCSFYTTVTTYYTFCVFLCGEAAEKKMVFTYTTYYIFVCFSAAKPQRKKWQCSLTLLTIFLCEKNGSLVVFTLHYLLYYTFVCSSAAKPRRKKWQCSLTLLTLRRSRKEKYRSVSKFRMTKFRKKENSPCPPPFFVNLDF